MNLSKGRHSIQSERDAFSNQLRFYINVLPYLILGGIAVTATVYILPRLDLPVTLDAQVWGAVGDFTGGVLNPFFSILTILLLILSLRLQNLELSDATQQLILTRQVHSQSLLYADTKHVFDLRAKTFADRMSRTIIPYDPIQPDLNCVPFHTDNKRIMMLVNFEDTNTLINYLENLQRFNQDLLDCAVAGLDLLEMGVKGLILRETIESLHPSVRKIEALSIATDQKTYYQRRAI